MCPLLRLNDRTWVPFGKSTLNGGVFGKIMYRFYYRCWIFQPAMFDYQMVCTQIRDTMTLRCFPPTIYYGTFKNKLWGYPQYFVETHGMGKNQRCDPINVSKWSGYESSTMPTWMCAFDLRFTAILLSSSHLATGCHSHVWLSRLTTAGFWGPQHHLSFYHVLLVGDYSSISTTVHYDSWDAHPT